MPYTDRHWCCPVPGDSLLCYVIFPPAWSSTDIAAVLFQGILSFAMSSSHLLGRPQTSLLSCSRGFSPLLRHLPTCLVVHRHRCCPVPGDSLLCYVIFPPAWSSTQSLPSPLWSFCPSVVFLATECSPFPLCFSPINEQDKNRTVLTTRTPSLNTLQAALTLHVFLIVSYTLTPGWKMHDQPSKQQNIKVSSWSHTTSKGNAIH